MSNKRISLQYTKNSIGKDIALVLISIFISSITLCMYLKFYQGKSEFNISSIFDKTLMFASLFLIFYSLPPFIIHLIILKIFKCKNIEFKNLKIILLWSFIILPNFIFYTYGYQLPDKQAHYLFITPGQISAQVTLSFSVYICLRYLCLRQKDE